MRAWACWAFVLIGATCLLVGARFLFVEKAGVPDDIINNFLQGAISVWIANRLSPTP